MKSTRWIFARTLSQGAVFASTLSLWACGSTEHRAPDAGAAARIWQAQLPERPVYVYNSENDHENQKVIEVSLVPASGGLFDGRIFESYQSREGLNRSLPGLQCAVESYLIQCQGTYQRNELTNNGGEIAVAVSLTIDRKSGAVTYRERAESAGLPEISWGYDNLVVSDSEPDPYRFPERLGPS